MISEERLKKITDYAYNASMDSSIRRYFVDLISEIGELRKVAKAADDYTAECIFPTSDKKDYFSNLYEAVKEWRGDE